ncbi:hypothetical protein [Baaleninema sp.]
MWSAVDVGRCVSTSPYNLEGLVVAVRRGFVKLERRSRLAIEPPP